MELLRSRKELRAPFHVLELHISPAVGPLEYRWGQPGLLLILEKHRNLVPIKRKNSLMADTLTAAAAG
jgi:hypothetical protein